MEISIKKPCHENWNDMTPNEQGAFCGKCVKTVIDFSNKSLEEIKGFFAGNEQQKICGRFEEQQLTALSFDAFFDKFRRFEFSKRFAVILFFTFGFWLFGASGASAQTHGHIKGDVQVQEPMLNRNVSTTPSKEVDCRKRPSDTLKVMGKIAPVKQTPTKPDPVRPNTNKPKSQKPEQEKAMPMIMGAAIATPVPKKAQIPKK